MKQHFVRKTTDRSKGNGNIATLMVALILGCCLLAATLSGLFYGVFSLRVVSDLVADDLLSRAHTLSRISSRYLAGEIYRDAFLGFYRQEKEGVQVFLYDTNGSYVPLLGQEQEEYELAQQYADLAAKVLYGRREVRMTKWLRSDISVAVAIRDNFHRTLGVLVLSKEATEVRLAASRLVISILLSMAAAALLMTVPAISLSKGVTDPIRKMTDVAGRISKGDFSRNVSESGYGEIGMLGASLNEMSSALSRMILELTETRNHFMSVLTSIEDCVVTVSFDANGNMIPLFTNNSAERNLKQEGIKGLLSSCKDEILSVFVDGGVRHVRWEKGEAVYSISITGFVAENGGKEAVLLLHDISEAERLEQTRRDYVANVSHELRTPIASIRSLAEALNDQVVDTEEDRFRYYGYILRESARLSRLINDLLELSRLQSGTVAMEKEPFSLQGLLNEIVARMEPVANDSGMDIELCPMEETVCHSNRDRIEQILVVLLDNAIRYAEEESVVRIMCGETEGRLFIAVHNRGTILPDDLPHLFERFYKADRSHSGNGTGLGLAIAQETAHRLDGNIVVESSGREVVFTLTLPKC